jgi:hypothetical protein
MNILIIISLACFAIVLSGITYPYLDVKKRRKELEAKLKEDRDFIERISKKTGDELYGFVTNKSEKEIIRAWCYDSGVRTQLMTWMGKPCLKLFKHNNKDHAIILSLENWQSFIVFLTESFALADNEANGRSEDIKITMKIERS